MSTTAGELALLRRDFAVAYDHRCTIVRTTGEHGWDSEGTDSTVVTDQPCYYDDGASRETVLFDGTRVTRPAVMLLPRSVSVDEGDRITAVTDQTGADLITAARGVASVKR